MVENNVERRETPNTIRQRQMTHLEWNFRTGGS
jgi:hypothetical protein